jgi:hypothetical protein
LSGKNVRKKIPAVIQSLASVRREQDDLLNLSYELERHVVAPAYGRAGVFPHVVELKWLGMHGLFSVFADGELPFCDTRCNGSRRSQKSSLDTRVRNHM